MARLRGTGATRSPLATLLAFLLLLVPQVLAVSAVVGIDLGTEYIKAALVKPGIPLEIVLTKDSRRKEISAVTFKPSTGGAAPKQGSFPERAYGSDALALAPRFPGNVYPNLKTLLGLPVDSAEVKEYAARHPALKVVRHKIKGTTAFESAGAFVPEEEAWLVEELLAMELQSIRENAEALAGSGSSVRSAVLTVPVYYTAEERRAVELAAELAGLKVLSLISDGMAVGLHYATSRQFPNVNEGGKPEHHMVFDMGAGSTKATVLRFQSRTVKDVGKFNKTVQEVQALGSGWDRTLGGDALNYLIVDDMIAQFAASPKAKAAGVEADAVKSHGRAVAKLTKEAERVRHVLSANQNTQASFEGLYDDVDFKYKVTRAEFEEMAATHAGRVGVVVQNALTAAGIELQDLDSVILHGGATRTPFVQKELEKLLGAEKLRTNVNSDEAAVFGAGFRAAELSPSFRVKEIRIAEAASYPAGIKWKTDEGKERQQRLWTAASHLGAAAKEITLPNREDFSATFYQTVPAPALDAGSVDVETKVLTTKNLTASVAQLVEKHKCERSDVKLKLSARLASENGEVDVRKVTVECEAEVKEGFVDGVKNLFGFGKKEQQPLKDGESAGEPEAETSSSTVSSSSSTATSTATTSTSASTSTTPESSPASESADAKPAETKKQLVVIPVDFTLEKSGAQLSKADVTALKDRLKAFEASDRARRQREEALNKLEAYTYKVRDLLEKEDFISHSTPEERATLEKKNSDASEWLYEGGAEATKEELRSRLKDLQAIVDPVQKRIDEAAKRPELVKGLQDALKSTKEFVADIKNKIAEYEAWHSSKSASASSTSATDTSSTSTTTAPPSSSSGDFDGLEDDDAASTTTATATAMEDVLLKERGPVPPLYTLDDLKASEDLYTSIAAWLEEKLAEQEKLGPTDDPVLLVKDLTEKREKLDKVGLELAMKGVRNFEKRKASEDKGKETKKSKKAKESSSTSTKSAKPAQQTIQIKPGEDGKMPSPKELDEMLKEFIKEDKAPSGEEANQEQKQKQEEKKEEKNEGHDEL
ncbi:Hsp70 protein-domain-containing protein [Thermothelomyces heterothallicus CBS 202.75]|uniref:Hsp70 protein-domain-containing protein n=1 Tax=Thermothelomyces heterothallicus CBS 202.75 TaxID=1149848 RepID=UPI003741F2A4